MNEATAARRQIAGAEADAIGGEAFSNVPEDYNGPCRMMYEGVRSGRNVAVFPTQADARAAGGYAVSVCGGGYQTAELTVATAAEVTHRTWVDWIAD